MTEQEYKEICAEVQNSGIPVPSQQKIIDACGKQVKKATVSDKSENEEWHLCPSCRAKQIDKFKYCNRCGQRLG